MVILDNYNFILLFNYYIQNTDLISRSVFFYVLIELLFVVHCHFLSHFHPNPFLASLYTILKSHALFLALLPQSATKIFPSLVIPLSTI